MSTLEGASRAGRAEDMLIAPKIAQAIFAALLDFFTWKLGQKVYGADNAASMATVYFLLHSLTSLTTLMLAARTYSPKPMAVVYFDTNVRQFI